MANSDDGSSVMAYTVKRAGGYAGYYRALPADEYPAISTLGPGLYPSSDAVFELGIDALIDRLVIAPGKR